MYIIAGIPSAATALRIPQLIYGMAEAVPRYKIHVIKVLSKAREDESRNHIVQIDAITRERLPSMK